MIIVFTLKVVHYDRIHNCFWMFILLTCISIMKTNIDKGWKIMVTIAQNITQFTRWKRVDYEWKEPADEFLILPSI